MNKKIKLQYLAKGIVFSQWSRKSFAIFASLQSVVSIGFLSGTISLLSMSQKGYSQTDTIQIGNHLDIEEVVVSSNRTEKTFKEVSRMVSIIPAEQIAESPAQSLQDLLRYAMNVDIRQRGAAGVQADVSIRGGSFDQTLFLINSIPVNDPQTGHHNLNIPINLESIERIEVLHGSGARIFGPNAFSGAINIITNKTQERKIRASISGGEFGLYDVNTALNYSAGKLNNYFSVAASGSDGYRPNTDFETKQIYYNGSINTAAGSFSLQAGYLDKRFGANSFYSPKYPDQYEHIRNLMASLSYNKEFTNARLASNVYLRRHQDRFELFREDKFAYNDGVFVTNTNDTAKYYQINYAYPGHNYHLTNVYGVNTNFSFDTKAGTTSLGFDARNEHILSNVLGTALDKPVDAPGETRGQFNKEAERNHVNFFVEQDYSFKKFNIAGGGLIHYNTDYNVYFSGGIESSYWLASKLKGYLALNQAMRMPTFTDLYYDGPDNVGNPDLKPEVANSAEIGLKGFENNVVWSLNGFVRDTRDAIDWVKKADEDEFATVNYTNLVTSGVEVSTRFSFKNTPLKGFVNYLNINYAYTNVNKASDTVMISAYSLDYLKHKFTIAANHKLYKGFGLSWNSIYQSRNGSYTDILKNEIAYEPFILLDVKLYYQTKKYEVFAECANILNTNYHDLGGIMQPGRWFKAGIKLNLSL